MSTFRAMKTVGVGAGRVGYNLAKLGAKTTLLGAKTTLAAGRAGYATAKWWRRTSLHKSGLSWAKGLYKGMFGKFFLASSIISGFQEGGLPGAAKSVASDLAITYVLGAAAGTLGVTAPIAALWALSYINYQRTVSRP